MIGNYFSLGRNSFCVPWIMFDMSPFFDIFSNKSTSSHILTKQATLGKKLLETSDREEIVSYTRALRWCNLFSPDQKLSLQTALSFLSIAIRVKNQLASKKPTSRKQRKKPQKRASMMWQMHTKTRPKAPAKTYRGGQFAVHKISISRACETKLGCVLSFLENAIKINCDPLI